MLEIIVVALAVALMFVIFVPLALLPLFTENGTKLRSSLSTADWNQARPRTIAEPRNVIDIPQRAPESAA
jgi:hypothetical protein